MALQACTESEVPDADVPNRRAPYQVFEEIIKSGKDYKENSDDFVDQVMSLLAEDTFKD